MAYLVLVRHGQSEWNALGKWTGWQDVSLTDQGRNEAQKAAKALASSGVDLQKAYTSKLKRAQQTLDEIKNQLNKTDIETVEHSSLNERHYGDYTGMNKWEAQKSMGDEAFLQVRRAWDHPLPNGETLKDVHSRVMPYYETTILADLKNGKNVIIAAHGNSLRALVKHLESIPDDEVHKLEIGTGEVYMYNIGSDGKIIEKVIFNNDEDTV
jgi:2,3-bisphosphoglycerate-dependent phosphoglycerate mutase